MIIKFTSGSKYNLHKHMEHMEDTIRMEEDDTLVNERRHLLQVVSTPLYTRLNNEITTLANSGLYKNFTLRYINGGHEREWTSIQLVFTSIHYPIMYCFYIPPYYPFSAVACYSCMKWPVSGSIHLNSYDAATSSFSRTNNSIPLISNSITSCTHPATLTWTPSMRISTIIDIVNNIYLYKMRNIMANVIKRKYLIHDINLIQWLI